MYRGGKRPVGSDGSDHWHRESIAWHYKVLAENKPRFKTGLTLRCLLTVAMFVRLLPAVMKLFKLTPLDFMQEWNSPPASWQWVWFAGVIFVPLGWRSMERTSIGLIAVYIVGELAAGILPVTLAIVDYYRNYDAYFTVNKTMTLACCLFLAVAAQVHFFSEYVAVVLIRAYYKVQLSKKDRKFMQ